MPIDTDALIGETISNLETLIGILKDEVTERVEQPSQLTPEARTCKEAGLTIGVLIPKLYAVLNATQTPRSPPRFCADCED